VVGHQAIENLDLVIDGSPEVAGFAVDLYEDLIEMPPPLSEAAPCFDAFFADPGGKDRTEPVPPQTHSFMQMSIPRSARMSSTLRNDRG
jgi:hypothetical protein